MASIRRRPPASGIRTATRLVGVARVLIFLLAISASAAVRSECVILLHGLLRTSSSMDVMAQRLEEQGYQVVNLGYPSRDYAIAELVEKAIPPALAACSSDGAVHFVTHSLGGILVRYYLSEHSLSRMGRVVMLGPPNQGSEVVDKLGNMPGFFWMNGPAGMELSTAQDSVPNQLGPVNFELGVIAGRRSINWILSMFIPEADDGKVAVSRTRIAGMRDWLVLPVTHPFMMKNDTVIAETLQFLREGHFNHTEDN